MTVLCVNVDHVATVRQARRATYPDPVEAAALAEAAGAAGITIHLRADRRHIQDADLAALRRSVRGKLNLEMAASEEMIAAALAHRPDQVTLVPERPEEVTTEGGLDLLAHGERAARAAARLAEAGIAVSVFIDPDPLQIERLAALRDGGAAIAAFEINTDAYARAGLAFAAAELDKVARATERGAQSGLAVYAGHGLSAANVGPVARIGAVEELNIGHWLVARAIMVGMSAAVAELLAAIR